MQSFEEMVALYAGATEINALDAGAAYFRTDPAGAASAGFSTGFSAGLLTTQALQSTGALH